MRSPSDIQLHPLIKSFSPGISLITAVKNRINTLAEALPTWINQPEIDEIVIVDWSSDQSLASLIEKYQDGRICLAVVKNQPKWILSQAFNLAARLATKDQILKIDADVKILSGFFTSHMLKPGLFYSGNWALGRDENEKHLNGMVYLYAHDFFKVNGYNEYIKSYGWDDTDLYQRLEASGLTRVDFSPGALYHIPHEKRTTLQDQTDFLANINDGERASINILINRYIASMFRKWSDQNRMTDFTVKETGPKTFLCTPAGEDKNTVPADIISESKLTALKERLDQLGFRIDRDLDQHFTFAEIKALYSLFQSKDATPENAALLDLINKYNFHYSVSIKQRNEGFKRLNTDLAEKNYLVREQKDHIDNLEQISKETELALWNANQVLSEKETFLQAKEALINEKDQVIHSHVSDLHKKDMQLLEKEQILVERVSTLAMMSEELHVKEGIVRLLEHRITEKESELISKNEEIGLMEESIKNKIADIQEKERKLISKNEEILLMNESIQNKVADIQEKERELISKNEEIRLINESIQIKTAYIQENEREIQSQRTLIHEQVSTLISKEEQIGELNLHLRQQQNIINDRGHEIQMLRDQISKLYQSYSWRVGHYIFTLLDRLAFWRRK